MKPLVKELNEEQKKIITATDGPILIIAGAGTGKTSVITEKIAYLIKSKNVSPSNILALTFSKKAAGEMLERVENTIGEHKDEIWISTFHSFCNNILTDHSQDIGLSSKFKLLNKIEQWIFFKSILDKLNLRYYKNISDPADCIDGFLRFISRAKDELISVDDYKNFVEKIENAQEKERSYEVVKVYEIYQQKLYENNFLDFGDLILKAYELFSKRKNILGLYQEKFKYILVDEFQDTNVAQIELICLLAKKNKNICVVGDDDQGIYRFRGASYASFVKFQEKFPDLISMRLTQNYRSTKNILSVAERVIKKNDIDRFDPQKNLWTKNQKGAIAELIITNSFEKEAEIIVNKIKELTHLSPKQKINFSDFAILYRAHSHKDIILKILKSKGVPFNIKGGIGIFETEEVKEAIAFLKVINEPFDSVSLFRVLSSNVFDIDIEELVKIARFAKDKEIPLFEVIEKPPFLLSEKTKNELKNFRGILSALTAVSIRSGVGELMYGLQEKTNTLKNLLKNDKEGARNLIRFYRFMQKYIDEHGNTDLSSFINYLEAFVEAGGELEIEEEIDNDAVWLMTIHQAKGLEFDYVFVIGLTQSRFPTRLRREQVPFPEELIKEKLPSGDYHIQEERRLFYVAITRAKKRLFLSAVKRPTQRLSIFTDEICDNENARQKDIKKSESQIEEADYMQFFMQKAQIKLPWKERFLPVPDSFSYSQIDTYRTCPLKYQFAYVYSIPIRPTIALRLGTDMHKIMEQFYRKIKENNIPSLEEFYKIFLNNYSLSVTEDNKKRDFECLKRYYELHREHLMPPLFLEEEFLLKFNDVSIKGRIDRIDELPDGTVEVIDYKTGKKREQKFVDENIQLDIYALACQKFLKVKPSVLSFYFLTTNEKVPTTRSQDDLARTKIIIEEIVAKIRQREFSPNPGYHCKWCDYKIICPAYAK